MLDYEPIDISTCCNSGLEALGATASSPLGNQVLRGLPFAIPADPQRCLILLDGLQQGVEVAIPIDGRTAQTLVFLHRQLSSELLNGAIVGQTVAEYQIRFADGTEATRQIRERYEIALPRTWIRDLPALALPDQKHGLPSRYSGDFSRAGRRATGVNEKPSTYYLWSWQNPKPEAPIDSVVIRSGGTSIVVAGLTLGHVAEDPIVPTSARAVRIDIVSEALAKQPFDVELDVDRGHASYSFPLPDDDADSFLQSPWKGFGEASPLGPTPSEGLGPYVRLQPASPAYAFIAATPSATVTVRQNAHELGRARWADIEKGQPVPAGAARIQLIDPGRNWVRTTVRDAVTLSPIPCRIHFRTPQGIPYQPHGHRNQVNADMESWHDDVGGDLRLGRVSYAYIDGRCEGWLPRGDVIVDVARGFEYEPIRTKIRIETGQRELHLDLRRWTNLNDEGWFAGDTHVHFVSAVGSHLEADAEGLNVVNVLMTQAGDLFSGLEEFEGRPSVSQRGDTVVYVGQENRQHFLGHLSLLGLTETVMPLSTGGSTEAELGGGMETTLAHWADRCHHQGGLVILPHLPVPNGEPAVLVATGRVDAVEMCEHKMYFHGEYYRYLNAGYRLPLVGGTDKMSSEVPVGLFRTYVHISGDQGFNYANWCQGIRQGRTFLSSGPIIDFKVDGREIGSTINLPSSGGEVEVSAWAESIFPIHRLELIERGHVIAEAIDLRGTRRLELHEHVKVKENSWLAIRVGARRYSEPDLFADAWARGVMAHSSPIYLACGDEWSMVDRSGLEYMLTMTDLALSHVRAMRLRDSPGTVTHHHGEQDHQAYLERPFHEAAAAIRQRIENANIGRLST